MEHLINTLSSPCPSPAQAGISFSRWEAEDLQFKFTQPVSGRAEIQLKSDSRKPVLDTGQSRHPLFREWVQKKKRKRRPVKQHLKEHPASLIGLAQFFCQKGFLGSSGYQEARNCF